MKKNATITAPLLVLIVLGLFVGSKFAEQRIIEAGGNMYLTVIIIQILIFILPAVIFCRLKGVGYAGKMNMRIFSPAKIGICILSCLFLICGTALIRMAQVYLFGYEEIRYTLFPAYMERVGDLELLFGALAFAIFPAICEEFIFRSILLTEYNNEGYNGMNASIASVILFGAMSGSLEILPIYLLVGIVCCMITYATGSSLTAFLVRMAFNAYMMFGEKYIFNAIVNPANLEIALFTFGFLFLGIGALTFSGYEKTLTVSAFNGTPTPSYLLKKDENDTPDLAATETDEAGVRYGGLSKNVRDFIEILFSPTFLLCILLFVVMLFGIV